MKRHRAVFRPRARILQLLGDELIRHHRLALFELVKNSYDADSPNVRITFSKIESRRNAAIVVEDSGEGMDLETVRTVWLEPGSQHRAQQRDAGKRTPRFNRLPVGEKGIGRFAAHKLGNRIEVITRRHRKPEVVISINWNTLLENTYLDDAALEIVEREPEHFTGVETGTRIEIRELRQSWSRGDVRRMFRDVAAMTSPFQTHDAFRPEITLKPDPGWTDGLADPVDLNRLAMFRFTFALNESGVTYHYEFDPLPGLKSDYTGLIRRRVVSQEDPSWDFEFLRFKPRKGRKRTRERREKGFVLSDVGFGALAGTVLAFDRDRKVMLEYVSDQSGLTKYLDEQGGIRVYRDGMRVYNYGEQGDDWLNLDVRRVQNPTTRLSNNVAVGEIHLDLEKSKALVEKTNREGFVESEAVEELKHAVLCALAIFENQRAIDKAIIRKAMETAEERERGSLSDGPIVAMRKLQRRVLSEGLYDRIGKDIEAVEHVYRQTHETLMSAVGAGLGLSMVFHEVERGIRGIHKALEKPNPDLPRVRLMTQHLVELLDGASNLVRASSDEGVLASDIARQTLYVLGGRFEHHGVHVINGFTAQNDFEIKGSRRMLVASMANLLDNALYWLEMKASGSGRKTIFVGPSHDFEDGPALLVADSGPGFSVPGEQALEPFRTTKSQGMGLGLYFANLAMKAHGGRVAFPLHDDVDIPAHTDGAIVALVFKGRP